MHKISTILFLLIKISVSGPFLNRLNALFVSSQKLYNTWYLAASRILTRVDTPGTITLVLFFANTFSSFKQYTVYADLPSFLSPCLITCDSFCPDILLFTENKILYILELTIGFETNIQINSNQVAAKYSSSISDLSPDYSKVMFINLWVLLGLWVLLAFLFYLCSKC